MRVQNLGWALVLGLLVPLSLQAQATGQITGAVTSELRQPLSGVQIAIKGTSLGTLTDANGRFMIANVPAGQQVVQAIFIGYAPQELTVTVAPGTPVVANLRLVTEAVALREVVVVGYGTQKREQVTGAVATVTAADFVPGPARSVASLIAGKLPGLAVVTSSGNPTDGPAIQLRGISTIQGGRSPLVVVDGVPGSLSSVAPEDVESVTLLKDGSAAAIYGSRASNGVILITTKKYSSGPATFRYDGYISQSTISRMPDFLSATDYRRLNDEHKVALPFIDFGFGTNWLDQLVRDPMSYRHNLSFSGGARNTNYSASLNLQNEQGVFQRSENTQFTTRANIRHQMFDGKMEIEGNLLNRRVTRPSGPDYNYIWRQAQIRNPTDRVQDESGGWQVRDGYFYDNPLQLLNEVDGGYEDRATRLNGTVTLRPISQLRFSVLSSLNTSESLSGYRRTLDHPSSAVSGNYASRSTDSDRDRLFEATGTYTEQFASHNVNLLGGYTYTDHLEEGFNASNTRFPGDIFDWNQLGLGDGMGKGEANMNSGKEGRKLIGFFGRLNYDWKNRYLLMASLRYEGDTRFGADHKWGMFPGVSVGWRVSEESFFKDRGVTGMAPNDPYLSLRSYSYGSNSNRFFYNGQWVRTLAPSRNPNPELKWEEKRETNFGANFAAMDSRLTGSIDVYRRETKDMLYNYSVPVPPYVVGSIRANVGTMQNNGVEVELGYDVVRRSKFSWNTNFNWSRNTNKLVTLSDSARKFTTSECFTPSGHTGEPIQQSTHRVCVGGPIGNFYGFRSVDIDTAGVFVVLDSAGNEISAPLAKQKDKRFIGNGLPKMYFGWNNTAQFGKFDVSLNLRGAADFQILNLLRAYYENPRNTQYNMLKSAFDPVYGKRTLTGDLAYVSYYIEDGDYIKLDNATIGYMIPASLVQRFGGVAKSARFYVSGRNLLTITGYKGVDPEVSVTGPDGLSPGIDSRDKYPTIRTFTAGMTVSF